MHRRHHVRREWRRDQLPALLGHFESRGDERLSGGSTEADNDLRLQDPDLGVEPQPAGGDLAPIRLFVQAPLPRRAPLEVLHRVRDVDRVTVDSRGVEGFVQDAPRRPDERLAGDVLFVARLLADEDDLGGPAALAKYRLRRALPQVASLAMRRRITPRAQAFQLRELRIAVSGLGRWGGRFRLWHLRLTEQATRPMVPAMRVGLVVLAIVALVGIGTAEAIISNGQLAQLPGRGRPALSAGGTALTLVGIALSATVYAVLGVVLARASSRETTVLPIGMVVGAGAALIGGAIRAYLIRDYLGGVLAGFGLADLLVVTLAVFVALSVLVSVAAGATLIWLSFRAARRLPRPRPPS